MKFPHPFLWAAAVENHSKQQNRDFRPDRTPKPLKFMWGNFYIQKCPTIFAHSLIFRPDSDRPHRIPTARTGFPGRIRPATRPCSRRTAAHGTGININACPSGLRGQIAASGLLPAAIFLLLLK
jgi:hypothetical protein